MMDGVIVVSEAIYYGLMMVAMLSSIMFMFLVVFIKGKIPEASSLMKAELFKRPWVHIHTSLNQLEMYAPKRTGNKQDENTYDVDKYLGVKLVPDPEKVENTVNGRRIIHYYSKAAPPLTAKESAACRDVLDHLSVKGIRPTESLIDALFIASDEEINSWYAEDEEMLRTIYSLKSELQNKFIQDGQFVWEVVKDFIFAASNDTARALDEFKSIAHEQADDINRKAQPGGDIRTNLMYFLIVVFGLAVAYKIMTA